MAKESDLSVLITITKSQNSELQRSKPIPSKIVVLSDRCPYDSFIEEFP